ncbi:MAG: DNA mismatch repair endonuclease MutL [Chlorobi bacterium]|nr:DNA mismatch repair endonuclease MutL [Chlorobiota bacterium]
MADIIRLLPDSVANQIAAGEVIQRPASVVKEMMENAVDAGAQAIHIQLSQAGKNMIQVIDDGCGMSETDARLAFERHATSKITSAEDLFSIRTMGFRGEALASIAAVAQVELKTKRKEDELGTHIIIEGSEVKEQKPVSCKVGSNFMIRNLFFNIPARRRFLKTNATELKHIITAFQRIVLTLPRIHFSLKHQETLIYDLPHVENLRQRISGIFGKNVNQHLIPLRVETSLVNIQGFIGKPEFAKKTFGEQYFFTNQRFLKHPYFHRAVTEAYQKILPPEAIPTYFIYFEIDPDKIDINIHPTKTEIKFEDERSVWQILHATVREALGKHNIVPSIDFELGTPIDIPVAQSAGNVHPPSIPVNPDYNPFREEEKSLGFQRKKEPPLHNWEKLYEGFEQEKTPQDHITSFSSYHEEDLIVPAVFFQFKQKYILLSVKSGLMIIDQKRAHQRVLFETFMQDVRQQGVTQKLLYPEHIVLNPADFTLISEMEDELKHFGFSFELTDPFGITISGIPAQIPQTDPKILINSLLETYKNTLSDPTISPREQLAHSMAVAAAIPYGKNLSIAEIQDLIDRLFACKSPSFTASGRTVFYILPSAELENFFE